MYLKSLHIQGFKTFEQSTTLEMDYPVIAIVGPNGSGKSNIVDALRWTLCEQNLRTLRARSMLDLIFSGTATRHPVSYAEAEVVFNNDGDIFGTGTQTVTIARRVFRSKESDFLIEGRDVQLRDVEQMLMATGLGFRHYPFIGQGEISRIFTMKPEERKALFEEVAGIGEYRLRKREALVRLEETRGNIARVEDLLAELNASYDHLALQAAAARQYMGLQERTGELELDIARSRYGAVVREQERAGERLAEAQEKMADIITASSTRQASYDDLQTQLRSLHAALREKNAQLTDAREDAYRLEKDLVAFREKSKYLLAEETRLVRQVEDFEKSSTQTAKLHEEALAGLELLRGEETEATAVLAAEQHAYDEAAASIEEQRKALAQAQSGGMQLETEVRQLFAQFNPLQFEYEEKKRLVASSAEVGGEQAADPSQQAIDDLEGRLPPLEEQVREWRSAALEVSRRLVLGEQEEAAAAAAAAEAAQAADRYRRMIADGAAFVAELEHQIRGGSDRQRLLDVVELGERQSLLLQVMRDELGLELNGAAWDELGDSLRREQRPLLATRYVTPVAATEGGSDDALCCASFVACRDGAPPAVAMLLHQLYLSPTLEQGLGFAQANPGSFYRIYCQDGFIIDGACVVSRLRTPIERISSGQGSTELDRMDEEARKLRQVSADLMESASGTRRERDVLSQHIAEAEQSMGDIRSQLRGLVIEHERERAVLRERGSRLEEAALRIAEIERLLAPLRERLTDRRGALARARSAVEAAEKACHEAEAGLLTGKDRIQAAHIRKNTVSARLQSLLEKRIAYEDQLASIGTEQHASGDSLAHVRQEREQVDARVGVLDARSREKSNELAAAQAAIDQLETDKRHRDAELSSMAAEIETVKSSRTRLESRVRELEVILAEGKGKLEQFTSRGDFGTLVQRPQPAAAVDAMQVELDSVRRSMTELEPVNMASIRESEDLAGRIAHLTEQDDDLTHSRAKLLALIEDLDQRASALFEETYAVVERSFQENFVKMFDGGEARLTRQVNGELTGIDIDVILPGKRRQPLELLSGGEKVLTATALQFALFKARPSLFYLLDEVDSALDEDNVHRFARLLREQEGAQFLVVTHNRETMLAADVLYGVTMQESGVSKVVSLRLESDETAGRQP